MTRRSQLALATVFPRRAIPNMDVLDPSVTRMRVHIADLDLYWHVNNGVYLQMMDVGRSNLIADLNGAKSLKERGWYPVVAASTVKYRRSLKLGQKFDMTTRVLGWDPRVIYLEQSFSIGDTHIARGIAAGRFLSKAGARIAAPDVINVLDPSQKSPDLPADVLSWARAVDVAHRED